MSGTKSDTMDKARGIAKGFGPNVYWDEDKRLRASYDSKERISKRFTELNAGNYSLSQKVEALVNFLEDDEHMTRPSKVLGKSLRKRLNRGKLADFADVAFVSRSEMLEVMGAGSMTVGVLEDILAHIARENGIKQGVSGALRK
jgi:hypothetical protein